MIEILLNQAMISRGISKGPRTSFKYVITTTLIGSLVIILMQLQICTYNVIPKEGLAVKSFYNIMSLGAVHLAATYTERLSKRLQIH